MPTIGFSGVFAQTEVSIFVREKEWTYLRPQIAWVVALIVRPYLTVVYSFTS